MHRFLAGLFALALFATMRLAGKGAGGGCLNKKTCTYVGVKYVNDTFVLLGFSGKLVLNL